jgi:hypothetical protein
MKAFSVKNSKKCIELTGELEYIFGLDFAEKCYFIDEEKICVGSSFVRIIAQNHIYIVPDEDELFNAVYLFDLQKKIAARFGDQFFVSFATEGIAYDDRIVGCENLEAVREKISDPMSGWCVFPEESKFGHPNFDNLKVDFVGSFILKYPKIARFLSLPEKYRVFTDGRVYLEGSNTT